MDTDRPAIAGVVADVAAAVSSRDATVSEDVYAVIQREIPQLRDDKPVQGLLSSSVFSNVDTCLQVMRHQIDLAAGPAAPRTVAFGDVAPVAMMLGTPELLRGWVLGTLGGLAADDEPHARLRETLLVFLQSGGSYKATAEQLTQHKNTVQYRIRKAEESLGRPVKGEADGRDGKRVSGGRDRHDVELALQVSHWLGASVLQSAR